MIPIVQHSDLAPFVANAAVLLEQSLTNGNVARGKNSNWLRIRIAASCERDTKQVTLTDSGTAGLIASLLYEQLRASASLTQRKVLVPRLSYAATRTAILHAGCDPVYLPVDNSGTLDLDCLDEIDTTDVLAIMPVVLWGHALDWRKIADWAASRNVAVVLDAAQAWGLKIPEWAADYIVYSFSANKPWPTFNTLGAIITKQRDASRLQQLLHHGVNAAYPGTRGYAAEDACAQAMATSIAAIQWQSRQLEFSYRLLGNMGDVHVVAPAPGRLTNWHKLVLRISGKSALEISQQQVECKQAYTYYLDDPSTSPSLYQIPTRGTLTDEEQDHIVSVLFDVLG